jgi:hypothetical protein
MDSDKKEKLDGKPETATARKKFTKPVVSIIDISMLVSDVYAGWTPCSGDYHGGSFMGT